MVGGAGRFLIRVCLATGLLAAAHQARGEAPPLRSIAPDAYSDQPAGIRYGSLLYNASLTSGLAWDTNIFSSKAHVVGDRILVLRPGLTISTLDPNYKFTFRSNLQQLDYEVSPSDNRMDGLAELHGNIRVQRDTAIDVGLAAARIMDPRSSILRRDLPENAAAPVTHNQYSAWIGLRRNFNPMVSTTTVTVLTGRLLRCPNPSPARPSTCSISTATLPDFPRTSKCGCRIACCCSAGTESAMNTYRNVQGFTQDDSIKFETVNGIEVGITPLITGIFSFHFGDEHFWADTIQSDPELRYRAELAWSPRRNLRLRAGVLRDFGGTSLDARLGRRAAHLCRLRARIRYHAPAVLSRQLCPSACQRGKLELGQRTAREHLPLQGLPRLSDQPLLELVHRLRLRAARCENRNRRVRSADRSVGTRLEVLMRWTGKDMA